jgi:putative N6-adenine-specific DNA methylase
MTTKKMPGKGYIRSDSSIRVAFLFLLSLMLTSTQAFITQSPMTIGQCRVRNGLAAMRNAATSDSYQPEKNINHYIATCIPGLAPVLADELNALGALEIEPSGNSAVGFQGSSEIGLKALLRLRTAHRLMELVATSDEMISSRDDIHDFIKATLDVKALLGDGKGGLLTISVAVVMNGRIPADINHSHYTALSIKNALCDVVRELRGDRPDVDVDNADVPLVAILRGFGEGAEISLYRCLHPPGSLHRRGYRGGSAMHKAAMKESMAAGLLLKAGWEQKCIEAKQTGESLILVDPMGGSGSLVLEAAMIAANLSPGLMRIKCGMMGHQIPPALRWKSGRGLMDIWREMLQEATQEARDGLQWISNSGQIEIVVNDIHAGALEICDASLQQAGLVNTVKLRQGDCRDLELKDRKCFIVTNPPWGVRLTDDMEESWESLRYLLKTCSSGTEAWVLSGNKDATKHLGLRRSQSMVLKTADQDLRWIQYIIIDKSNLPPDKEGDNEFDYLQEESTPPQRRAVRSDYRQVEQRSDRRVDSHKVGRRLESRSVPSGYKARSVAMGRDYPRPKRKGDSEPLTEKDREAKRNSWNL